MTETALLVLIVAASVIVLMAILLGRSIRLDTKHIKAQLSPNGGTSAVDMLHARFDALDKKVRAIAKRVDAHDEVLRDTDEAA